MIAPMKTSYLDFVVMADGAADQRFSKRSFSGGGFLDARCLEPSQT